MINCFSKLSTVVWSNYAVKSGVRWGEVLSPILLNFYINDLISSLKASDLGCHVHDLYVGCILYADGILPISASLSMLQDMTDVCFCVGKDLLTSFNYSKSHCTMISSRNQLNSASIKLNCHELAWVDKIRYLVIVSMS